MGRGERGGEQGRQPALQSGRAPARLVTVDRAGAELDAVRDLFLEYGESLAFNTCFGGLDEELAALPRDYVSPHGCLLLVRQGPEAAGCVGVRRLYLDTLPTMLGARSLYAPLGFTACAPYYDNRALGSDCFELLLRAVTRKGQRADNKRDVTACFGGRAAIFPRPSR